MSRSVTKVASAELQPTGETKITKGYNLPSYVLSPGHGTLKLISLFRKHVLHTVGPIWYIREAEQKAAELRSCYRSCLDLTVENNLESVVSLRSSAGIA
jgi:O-acetyl-ADP-ribose deacetylase (regulator of RNase III)